MPVYLESICNHSFMLINLTTVNFSLHTKALGDIYIYIYFIFKYNSLKHFICNYILSYSIMLCRCI